MFTASHSNYANKVIDFIDPTNEIISHRLFREHCFHTADGVIFVNRDLREGFENYQQKAGINGAC